VPLFCSIPAGDWFNLPNTVNSGKVRTKERLSSIIQRLAEVYPTAHCELDFKTPFQLLVATILSAQCTDKRVNIVTRDLFPKYPTAVELAGAGQDDLERVIKSTGFYRNKAKNLRAMAKDLVEKHRGEVPGSMRELTELAGVGRKTANVVLGNAFSAAEGIVVDTHVGRLARRFGLTTSESPEKIEAILMRLVPKSDWTNFSHWLIWHGRRRCYARNPDCTNCELGSLCPSYEKFVKKVVLKGRAVSGKKAIA
jgi:endonuclease-3